MTALIFHVHYMVVHCKRSDSADVIMRYHYVEF